MKNILLILLVNCCFLTAALAQVTRTASQTITAGTATTVNLDLGSNDVEIAETKGSRIIVEASIGLDKLDNVNLLEFVIKTGRYELESKLDNTTQTLTITRKKNLNILMVKGQECKENVKYKILIPSSVKFVHQGGSTASIN